MKGREKHIFILLLMLIGFSRQNFAQEGNPLQFIPGVSQSAWSNPAFQNKDEKLVLGLPLISGTRMNWNANFALDYIFTKNFVYNLDRFSNELGGPGHELTTISIPSLYLSLRSENQNFTFSVTERIYLESTFDNEFLKFIDQGLIPYYGKTESYGPMKIHGYFYREMAFAYSLKTDGGLSIGIRPKLLFGRMNYVMDEMTINVYTDTEAAQLLIEPTGSYQLGGNFDVRNLPDGTSIRPNPEFSDYFFNFRNPGAAVDLGIDYRTGDTEISASLLDLGFFSMKNQVYDVTYSDVLRYNEEDLYQSTNSDEANYLEPKLALQQLIDSIPYVISAVPSTQNLKENIPFKLNAVVRQHLSKKTDLGISAQLTVYKDRTQNYLTSFYHTEMGDHFNLTGSISLLDFEKLLPGAGASYTGKNVQAYLSTNNITALLKPNSAKYINLCFGVNFLFSTR